MHPQDPNLNQQSSDQINEQQGFQQLYGPTRIAYADRKLQVEEKTIQANAKDLLANYYSEQPNRNNPMYTSILEKLSDIASDIKKAAGISTSYVPVLEYRGFTAGEGGLPSIDLSIVPKQAVESPFELIRSTRIQYSSKDGSSNESVEDSAKRIYTDSVYLVGKSVRFSSAYSAGLIANWQSGEFERSSTLFEKTRLADAVEIANHEADLNRLDSRKFYMGWDSINSVLNELPIPNSQISLGRLQAQAEKTL